MPYKDTLDLYKARSGGFQLPCSHAICSKCNSCVHTASNVDLLFASRRVVTNIARFGLLSYVGHFGTPLASGLDQFLKCVAQEQMPLAAWKKLRD